MNNQKSRLETQKWFYLIEKLKSSDLTQAEFAKENNVAVHQLNYWKSKFNKKDQKLELKMSPQKFVQVTTSQKVNVTPQLPDPKWLATLIRELYAFNK